MSQLCQYVHSCLELAILVTTSSSNPSQKSVVLESSAKPSLGCQIKSTSIPRWKILCIGLWGLTKCLTMVCKALNSTNTPLCVQQSFSSYTPHRSLRSGSKAVRLQTTKTRNAYGIEVFQS